MNKHELAIKNQQLESQISDLQDRINDLEAAWDMAIDQKLNAYYARDKEIEARKRAESKLYDLQGVLSEIEFNAGIQFKRLSVADQTRLIELLQDF